MFFWNSFEHIKILSVVYSRIFPMTDFIGCPGYDNKMVSGGEAPVLEYHFITIIPWSILTVSVRVPFMG